MGRVARVLVVHNHYRHHGGEDEVVSSEVELLQSRGHDVRLFTMHNDAVAQMGRLLVALRSVWNHRVYRCLRTLLGSWHADVVHVHNTFPLVSAAAHHAARASGAAVVQTIHNYRSACVNALLYRDGRPCEECLGRKAPWHGVLHGCYRGSRLASAAVAVTVAGSRALGVTDRLVARFIIGSRFAADKLVQAGIPTRKIVVKPNFLEPDPGPGPGAGSYALFVGRLVPEKGVGTLLDAWRLPGTRLPLRIVGGGPLAPLVERAAESDPGITWLGELSHAEVITQMGNAACLVIPSEWYETFGRVGMEALACGTPIVAARIGAVAELVDTGRTGVDFSPGNAAELAAAVGALAARPQALAAMRASAREAFEARYASGPNYGQLMEIYDQARDEVAKKHART